MLDVIGEAEWRETVKAWLLLSRETPSVIYPLLPYLLGSARQEIDITARVEHVEIETARRVLRVIGGTERSA